MLKIYEIAHTKQKKNQKTQSRKSCAQILSFFSVPMKRLIIVINRFCRFMLQKERNYIFSNIKKISLLIRKSVKLQSYCEIVFHFRWDTSLRSTSDRGTQQCFMLIYSHSHTSRAKNSTDDVSIWDAITFQATEKLIVIYLHVCEWENGKLFTLFL